MMMPLACPMRSLVDTADCNCEITTLCFGGRALRLSIADPEPVSDQLGNREVGPAPALKSVARYVLDPPLRADPN